MPKAAAVDDQLRRRLDALEARGRRSLSRALDRRALGAAARWAAPASLIGPLVLVGVSLWRTPGPPALVAGLLLPPLLAGGLAWARTRRAGAADRSRALALLDHQLDLNDRVQTADEFSRGGGRTAFQQAALDEASPWMDRALAEALRPEPPLRPRRSRLWLWPVAALAVSALLFLVEPLRGPAPPRPLALERSGAGPAASASAQDRDAGASPEALAAARVDGASEGASVRPAGRSGGLDLPAAFARLAAMVRPEAAAASRAAEAAVSSSEADENAAPGGGAGQGEPGSVGRGASRGAGASTADDARPPAGAPAGPRSPTAEGADAAGPAVSPRDLPGGRPSSTPPPANMTAQAGSEGAQAGQPPQPSRGRRGDQGDSGRERGAGQSGAGQGAGEEAGPKRGRGVAGLLLATPMQDRLTGIAGPGQTATSVRNGAPQPMDGRPAAVTGEARARGEGDRSAARITDEHDQRLVRDYFVRRNAGDR